MVMGVMAGGCTGEHPSGETHWREVGGRAPRARGSRGSGRDGHGHVVPGPGADCPHVCKGPKAAQRGLPTPGPLNTEPFFLKLLQ